MRNYTVGETPTNSLGAVLATKVASAVDRSCSWVNGAPAD